MSHRSVPAPFLTKTYQLVDDGSTDDVVSWNGTGTTFVVWNNDEFSKDLLPAYFKHNNFSSFVRQLNTYGFRKIVPDKWEFSNDNFKRGHKEDLTNIRRRQRTSTTSPSPVIPDAGKAHGGVLRSKSPSKSGDDLGSGSTSTSLSRDSKNPGSVATSNAAKFGVISEENQMLKMENEKLSSELIQTKKKCDELIGFLNRYVKFGPDQSSCIVGQGSVESSPDDDDDVAKSDRDDDDENGGCMKLFGVWMKENKKKRGRNEIMDFCGVHHREMKKGGAPWMDMVSYPGLVARCVTDKNSIGTRVV